MSYTVSEYTEPRFCPRCLGEIENSGDSGDCEFRCSPCDATMSYKLPLSLVERDSVAASSRRDLVKALADGLLRTVPVGTRP